MGTVGFVSSSMPVGAQYAAIGSVACDAGAVYCECAVLSQQAVSMPQWLLGPSLQLFMRCC